MRVRSEIWIGALVRRVFSAGGYAAIERRGADEAGAIFVRARHRDGLESLLAPAPQSFFETDRPDDRIFEVRVERQPPGEIDALLAREASFDPDFWVVEIEIGAPEEFLTVRRA